MGREMAHLLLRRIERPNEPPSHVIFATELIIGESSGAPSRSPTPVPAAHRSDTRE
jgi:DNA-binding LacI/PurR family transcriptional regulator